MSHVLSAWMKKYIEGCQKGTPADKLMAECGVDLPTFEAARRENETFRNALENIIAGVGLPELSAAEILRLLRAQVSDERAAAYFGLTKDEMIEKIKSDPLMLRVYETGRMSGQAQLQVAQFEGAISGDTNMQKHLGQHVLQQKEEKTDVATLIGITLAAVKQTLESAEPERIRALEAKHRRLAEKSKGVIIEGESTIVTEE